MSATTGWKLGLGLAAVASVLLAAGAGPTQAPPEPATWELLSSSAIGARAFIEQHPSWDGRGVVIAICDTGVDPTIPGLHETSTGDLKVIDARDFSGEGDVALEAALFGEDEAGRGLHGRDGRWLRGFEQLDPAPLAGTIRVGYLDESKLAGSAAQDLDGNGRSDDVYGVVVYEAEGRRGVHRAIVVFQRMGEAFAGFVGFALAVPHAGVKPVLGQQLRMCALFNNAPAFEHDDGVGMHNGRQTVGNDQRRAVFCHPFKSGLDFLFRIAVKR